MKYLRFWGAALRPRVVLSLLASATVAGCVTASGPSYTTIAQHGLRAGQSRVVVYAAPGTGGWPIKLDGQAMGDLAQDGFIYRVVPAGTHQLTGEMFGYPGVTRRDFAVASGRTSYFMVRMSDRAKGVAVGMAVGGLVGGVIASAATSGGGGPVDIIAVDEASGRRAVAEMKVAQ